MIGCSNIVDYEWFVVYAGKLWFRVVKTVTIVVNLHGRDAVYK